VERPRLWLGLGHEHDHSALKRLCIFLTRLVDDDRLGDACWTSEMRELFENKWFAVGPAGGRHTGGKEKWGNGKVEWGKVGLRAMESNARTRGRDGWNGVGKDGSVRFVVSFFTLLVARFFTLFLRFFVVLVILNNNSNYRARIH
jgi:hypothetical protein